MYDIEYFVCLPILVNMGWIPRGHGVWSFLYVVGFSRLKFCWEFLHLDGSKILAYNFLFFCNVIVLFWYEGEGGFIECLSECSLFLHLFRNLRRLGLTFFLCVWYNLLLKPSHPGLLLVVNVIITYSISFLMIILFNFISSWPGGFVSLECWPFLLGCQICWRYNCSSYSLLVFCVSVVSVEMSSFSFLTWLIWVLASFWWVCPEFCQFCFTLSKNHLGSLNFCCCFFESLFSWFPLWSLWFPSFWGL